MLSSDSLSGTMFLSEGDGLRRFREMEREHISKNQWYLGEKLGRPVSWEEAEWDWFWSWRREWLYGLRKSGIYPFD